MFVSIKSYNKFGQKRYGSELFIDYNDERIVEFVDGESNYSFFLYFIPILIVVNILSINFIGLISNIINMLLFYYISKRHVDILLTKQRAFFSFGYRSPRIVKLSGIYSFIIALYSIFKLFNFQYNNTINLGIYYFERTFAFFGFLPIVFQKFMLLYIQNSFVFIKIDNIITITIYITIFFKFYFMHYEFGGTAYKSISEVVVNLNHTNTKYSWVGFIIFNLFYLSLFKQLSLILILIDLFLIYIFPKKEFAKLSLYGRSNNKIINTITFKPDKFIKLSNGVATIFGWKATDKVRFPLNIIPNTVTSIYPTGLQASLTNALMQGNTIGALISMSFNIYVIIKLIIFVIKYKTLGGTVFLISITILFSNISIWIIIRKFVKLHLKNQEGEFLFIADDIIAIYKESGLWIIRGDLLEGKADSTRLIDVYFNYDRIKGLNIAWARIFIIIIALIIIFSISFWVYIGALNVKLALYILPFLFNLGFKFLSQKASTELSFFILGGLAIWLIVILIYPRFFKLTRPRMIIKTSHLTRISLIMKNYEDLVDASLEYTHAILNSFNTTRGKYKRPGYYLIDVYVYRINIKKGYKCVLLLGDAEREIQLVKPHTLPIKAIKNLVVSAKSGIPKILIKCKERNEITDKLIFELYDMKNKYKFQVKYGEIILKFKLMAIRS